jgi:hypothetical protein
LGLFSVRKGSKDSMNGPLCVSERSKVRSGNKLTLAHVQTRTRTLLGSASQQSPRKDLREGKAIQKWSMEICPGTMVDIGE